MKNLILIFLISSSQVLFANTITYTVHFEYNKATLHDTDALHLIKLVSAYSAKNIKITGHCDSVGSIGFNKNLSEKRVQAVKKLLTDNGVQKQTIIESIGYSKLKPLNKNSNEQERALNRRVEVSFISVERKKEIIQVEKVVSEKVAPDNSIEPSKPFINTAEIKVGQKLILKNLNFEGGRHIILENSKDVLYELLDIMKTHPTLQIEIGGHVCCTNLIDGDDLDTGTQNLSVNRALEVYNFLVHFGIDKNRMKTKGYGSSQKLYPLEQNTFEQSENRRVELKILHE